jgi:acyl-CoA thioester hydrolase
MARVKLKFPTEKPLFTATISVRIGDINYGGHVGNDAILSILHEARMQMLGKQGFDEMNAWGSSMIMADVMIAYKGEAFYGDSLSVEIYAEEISTRSFDFLYRIITLRNNTVIDVADAKTGMVCYDYKAHKIAVMNDGLKQFLQGGE